MPDPAPFEFLPRLRAVADRVRAGDSISLEELADLKAENKRRALEAESQDRPVCDSMPTWINTTNSTVCNLRCGFCPQAYGKGVDWKMEEEVYQQVVAELYPAAQIVQLSAYGEPMMTPKLHDRIEDMERFGVRLEMVSNMTLMKGERLVERMARVMGLLTVSMDGARPSTYESLRVGAKFDEVVGNIRNYNEHRRRQDPARRAPNHFNFILMRRNLGELSDFLRLAQDLEAEHVTVSHLVLLEKSFQDEMLGRDPTSRRRTNEALAEARATAAQLRLSVNLPPPFRVEEDEAPAAAAAESPTAESPAPAVPMAPPMRCWFLWQRMYVGTFGDVVPCCLSGIHANGNVKGSDFFTQWNSELYQEMRRRVHGEDPYGPCKTCYLVNRSSDVGEFDKTR